MKMRSAPWSLAVLVGSLLACVATSEAGVLYVTDFNGTTVNRVDESGHVSTFATAGLDGPIGVVVDSTGNVFVSNVNNNQIHKFSQTGADLGIFATVTNVPPYQQYGRTGGGLAFDSQGNLYSGDFNNGDGAIHKISPAGVDLGAFAQQIYPPGPIGGGSAAQTGLAFDASGNLFSTDSFFGALYKYSPTGTLLGAYPSEVLGNPLGLPSIGSPFGVAIGQDGNVYVADTGFGNVHRLSPNLDYLGVFASIHATASGLAFDSSGYLYVSNYDAGSIRRFAPDGSDLGDFATGLGGPAFLAFGPRAVPVPEPASLVMLCTGIVGMLGYARRKSAARRAFYEPSDVKPRD